MKKNIFWAALAGSLFLTTSCVDLNQEPQSFITQEDYLSNIDESSLAKLTGSLYTDLWYNNYGFNTYMTCLNVSADDMMYRKAKANNRLEDYWALHPSIAQLDKDMGIFWTLLWKVIKDSNDIINNVSIPDDEAKAESFKQLLGESHFMRGFSYFTLVRIFGDVPMILDNNKADNRMPKSSVSSIYNEIILKDLVTASNWLPNKSRTNSPASPSKWAAKACLADVYMNMAGWPLKEEKYYADAAALTKEIIDNHGEAGLELERKYSELWKEANKTKTNEVMFALLHSNDDKNASQYGTSYYPSDYYAGGWADYYGNEDFYLNYPNDERKEFNYMTEWPIKEKDETGKNKVINYKESADGLPAIAKYQDYDVRKYNEDGTIKNISAQSNGITSIYRYADVLLMYAEASVRATGTVNQNAIDAIQSIQKRAGYIGKGIALTETTDKDAFLQAVSNERGWEFFAEMRRWFELVRLEKLDEVKGDELWNNSFFKANNHYYFPIPSAQIQLTGWENNKGY